MAIEAHVEAAPPRPKRRRPASSLIVSGVGLGLVALVLAWLAVNLVQNWSTFVQLFFFGLTRGALYALIALGYTLVYGILELINFAHGDVFMIGGMIAATFVIQIFALGASPPLATLVLAILAALAAATIGCGL